MECGRSSIHEETSVSDPDEPDADNPEIEPGPPRAMCPTCMGMGAVNAPKLAALGGAPRTVFTHERCSQCYGERFLHGIDPSV
jgi:hypothetical protein